MRKILLLSRVNTSNLGDQLIVRSMMKLFSPCGDVGQGDLICSRHVNSIRVDRRDLDNGTQFNDPKGGRKDLRDKLSAVCRLGFLGFFFG